MKKLLQTIFFLLFAAPLLSATNNGGPQGAVIEVLAANNFQTKPIAVTLPHDASINGPGSLPVHIQGSVFKLEILDGVYQNGLTTSLPHMPTFSSVVEIWLTAHWPGFDGFGFPTSFDSTGPPLDLGATVGNVANIPSPGGFIGTGTFLSPPEAFISAQSTPRMIDFNLPLGSVGSYSFPDGFSPAGASQPVPDYAAYTLHYKLVHPVDNVSVKFLIESVPSGNNPILPFPITSFSGTGLSNFVPGGPPAMLEDMDSDPDGYEDEMMDLLGMSDEEFFEAMDDFAGEFNEIENDDGVTEGDCPTCPNPVSRRDGTLMFSVHDFSYKRPGFPLRLSRFYSPKHTAADQDLGRSWMTNYDSSIVFDSEHNRAIVNLPFKTAFFKAGTLNSDNNLSYIAPRGGFATLVEILKINQKNINFVPRELAKIQFIHLFKYTDKYGTTTYYGSFVPGAVDVCKPILKTDLNGNQLAYTYENWVSSSTPSIVPGTITIPKNPLNPDGPTTTNISTIEIHDVQSTRLKSVSASPFVWSINFEYSNESTKAGNTTAYSGNRLVKVTNSVGDAINYSYSPEQMLASVDRGPNYPAVYTYQVTNLSVGISPPLTGLDDNLHKKGDKHPRYTYATDADGKYTTQVFQNKNGRGQVLYEFDFSPSVVPRNSNYEVTVKTTAQNGNIEKVLKDTYRRQDGVGIERISTVHYLNDSTPMGTETFQYNSDHLMTSRTDGNGHTFFRNYDALGNRIYLKDGEGYEKFFTFDNVGHLTHSKDKNGNERTFLYSDGANLTEVDEPLGKITKFTYKPGGLLGSVTDANGNVTSMSYDGNGNLLNVTSAENEVTNFLFDVRSRLTSHTDALGGPPSMFSWNEKNQLFKVANPDGTSKKFEYSDPNGNLSAQTDENGNQKKFIFDLDDNLKVITANNGISDEVTNLDYSANSKAITLTDAENHSSHFEFNNFGKLNSSSDPNGKVTTFGYDPGLRLATKTDARGIVTTLTYFKNDRLKKMEFSDGLTMPIEYTYDGNGNRTGMNDGEGQKIYSLDALNRIYQIQNVAQNFQLNYSFDLVGNRKTMTSNKISGVISYSYFKTNLLKELVDVDGAAINYHYNGLHQLEEVNYPFDIVKAKFGYDPRNHRLTFTKNANSKGEVISAFEYGRDFAGNITRTSALDGDTVFSYDSIYRLTKVDNGSRPAGIIKYNYDKVGNRIKFDDGGNVVFPNYDSANELGSYGNIGFTYDLDGNMKSKVTGGVGQEYQWDALSRLIEVDKLSPASTILARYIYDGENRRIRKTNGTGQVTNYLFDGNSPLVETDSSGIIKKRYTGGVSAIDDRGTKIFYLYDGLGNVANLVDKAGNILESYHLDPFGKTLGVGSDTNGFRFVGAGSVFSDDDTSLQLMGRRWYDPQLGRFISRDPVSFSGGVNLYVYAGNSPLNRTDPFGLCDEKEETENFLEVAWDWVTSFFSTSAEEGNPGTAKTLGTSTSVGGEAPIVAVGTTILEGGAAAAQGAQHIVGARNEEYKQLDEIGMMNSPQEHAAVTNTARLNSQINANGTPTPTP